MTLGDKIRRCRKISGLSQQQLANALCVSRSAIAKWESGNGMPDIENLKMLSKLFCVSVDYLLNEDCAVEKNAVREEFDLGIYGRGCNKVKKDRMMRQRFPYAKITSLHGRPNLNNADAVMDNSRGFLTDVPFGAPEYIDSVKNLNREFYLVESQNEQLFVIVNDNFLEVRPLEEKICEERFSLQNWTFIRCAYIANGENDSFSR